MDSVLILADESERWLLAAVVEREDLVVLETDDPGDALQLLIDKNPQLVILAEEAPPVEGVEFLPLVRRLTSSPIIVTGWGGEVRLTQALLQGADAYIARPIDTQELHARIRALLRWSTYPEPPDHGGQEQP